MRTPLSLCPFVLLAALGLTAGAARPAEPDGELVYAERVLKDAKVDTDGPGLLAFFKARTLAPADQERLAGAVRKLAAESLDTREQASTDLVAAGRLALAYLRPAAAAKDPEVGSRARRCIEEIERVSESALVSAAAQVIAARRPAGATEALLGCLP